MKPYDLPLLLSGEVRDYAAGLIGNSLRALMSEPEEGRSGWADLPFLVRQVSRLDPPSPSFCNGDCPRHLLACELAVNALQEWMAQRA
ncbi:hypothetical protein FHW58_004854 [Duganella sp. 1224]|uniref:hypothetical protein n=1 Tax=Duganella sp. 1224 TaxID=2587052 RepID=UPI0015CCF74F|nr:hypothetical protein [Duganella sp. 1224]NYE63623.1 hypothetical protein [Duganella sp. 1224]